MIISFDYEEFISEIKAEIKGELLKLTDNVQVLRGEYKEVVDWFYDDKTMNELYSFAAADKDTEAEAKEIMDDYRKNKNDLQLIMVSNLLIELQENNHDL